MPGRAASTRSKRLTLTRPSTAKVLPHRSTCINKCKYDTLRAARPHAAFLVVVVGCQQHYPHQHPSSPSSSSSSSLSRRKRWREQSDRARPPPPISVPLQPARMCCASARRLGSGVVMHFVWVNRTDQMRVIDPTKTPLCGPATFSSRLLPAAIDCMASTLTHSLTHSSLNNHDGRADRHELTRGVKRTHIALTTCMPCRPAQSTRTHIVQISSPPTTPNKRACASHPRLGACAWRYDGCIHERERRERARTRIACEMSRSVRSAVDVTHACQRSERNGLTTLLSSRKCRSALVVVLFVCALLLLCAAVAVLCCLFT